MVAGAANNHFTVCNINASNTLPWHVFSLTSIAPPNKQEHRIFPPPVGRNPGKLVHLWLMGTLRFNTVSGTTKVARYLLSVTKHTFSIHCPQRLADSFNTVLHIKMRTSACSSRGLCDMVFMPSHGDLCARDPARDFRLFACLSAVLCRSLATW